MAQTAQHGPSKIAELGVSRSPAASGLTLLTGREILRLDVESSNVQLHRALPGLQEERRFHKLYPDILVQNTVLREYLREDYRLAHHVSHHHSKHVPDEVVFCRAQGDQSRLHDALAVVSNLQRHVLHFVLLQKEDLETHRDNVTFKGQTYGIKSSTKGQYTFAHKIIEITAGIGRPTPILLARTEYTVYCLALSFQGGLRNTVVECRIIFELSSKDFLGHQPVSCSCFGGDRWSVYAVCSNGCLHEYHSGIRPKLHATTRSSFTSFSKHLLGRNLLSVIRPSVDEAHLLITYHDKILYTHSEPNLNRLVFASEAGESIVSIKPTLVAEAGQSLLVFVLTTRRLLLFDVLLLLRDVNLMLEDRHNFNPATYLGVQVMASPSAITVNLHMAEYNLSILYRIPLQSSSDQRDPCEPSRLKLDDIGYCSSILLFPIQLKSSEDNLDLIGALCFDRNTKLMSVVLGDIGDQIVHKGKASRTLAPALITSEVDAAALETRAGLNNVPMLDLDMFYHDTLTDQTAGQKSLEPQIPKGATNSSFLASQIFPDHDCPSDLLDDSLETLVVHLQEQGYHISETSGLTLCGALAGEEADATTAERIEGNLHSWYGQGASAADQHTRDQARRAAQSLALSTIGICRIADRLALLDSIHSKDRHRIKKTSYALEKLKDDWRIDELPEDYRWHSVDGREHAHEVEKFILPEIPAFQPRAPPQVVTSTPARLSSTRSFPPTSEDDFLHTATQPVGGRFAERKVKKKKKAGFR